MTRLMLVMVVACALMTACARDNTSQPGAPGDKAAAPAAAPANQPGAPGGSPAATPAASTPAAARGSEATPPAAPVREVTIPAGTSLTVTLTTPIASDTSKVEDPVNGTLARSITVSGETAVPAGAQITGSVLEADPSGRVKGRASIAFRFDHLVVGGERQQIQTDRIARRATADTKGDLKKGGLGAGAGAIIGGIAGGGKGAAIGSVVGGTGAVVATRGKEIRLAAGDTVTTRLLEPLKILVGDKR